MPRVLMMDCMESDIVLACAENSSFMRSIANTKKAAVNAISLENNLEEKGETRFCF